MPVNPLERARVRSKRTLERIGLRKPKVPPKASLPSTRQQVMNLLAKGGAGAEIGVFKGDFAAEILSCVQPRRLYLIDPWINMEDETLSKSWYAANSKHDMSAIYDSVCARFAEQSASGTVEIMRQKSGDALKLIEDDSLDFVYVDGDHRYEGVLADLTASLAKLKCGGVLAGDDYSLNGWWGDGVVRAVHETLGRHASELQILLFSRRQFVIQKRA